MRQWQRVMFKELLTGTLNGMTIALVTGLGVLVWSHSAGLSLVIGAAMILSMALAGLAGAAIPVITSYSIHYTKLYESAQAGQQDTAASADTGSPESGS